MDAYFDIFSGISGNMILGALIDLGVEVSDLEKELDKLGISNEYKIKTEKVNKNGIGGTYVEVELMEKNHTHLSKENIEDQSSSHNHKHDHDHDHTHEHNHNHDHQPTHSHMKKNNKSREKDNPNHNHRHGRNLDSINNLIGNSDLSEFVKEKSKEIFLNLAKAEGKIHGKDINEIHFHEVGAVDAIVDIVGSVIGMGILGIENIYVSPINTGTGFVNCEHGKIPVPAPATLELLKGFPIYSTGIKKELVTPTGAAVITTLTDNFGNRPEMEIERTGYGAGSYELEIPNMLRVNLGKFNNQKKN
ncbi:MAG: LarC family nickel insertion protein [Halanaerobiales bacterium]